MRSIASCRRSCDATATRSPMSTSSTGRRQQGSSKYGFFDRLAAGIVDLAGVGWLLARRRKVPVVEEIETRVL